MVRTTDGEAFTAGGHVRDRAVEMELESISCAGELVCTQGVTTMKEIDSW